MREMINYWYFKQPFERIKGWKQPLFLDVCLTLSRSRGTPGCRAAGTFGLVGSMGSHRPERSNLLAAGLKSPKTTPAPPGDPPEGTRKGTKVWYPSTGVKKTRCAGSAAAGTGSEGERQQYPGLVWHVT